MQNKERLRKKFFLLRKKKYFNINESFFVPLKRLLKKKYKKKIYNFGCYYPTSFEVNILKLFDIDKFKNFRVYLPVISKKNLMNFYLWKNKDVMQINKFGMLEPPTFSDNVIPDIMLLPLLAFDKEKNRLGYGKGYYDKFLSKHLIKKKILTVGIGFSFQEYSKIPSYNGDVKLDHILTEKGLF